MAPGSDDRAAGRGHVPVGRQKIYASLNRSKPVGLLNAARRHAKIFIEYFTATFATISLISLYLQYIKSFDSRSAGLVLLISTLITAPLVAYAGRLSDHHSPHAIALIGIILTAAGLLPMTIISFSTPTALALTGIILIMAGGAIFSPLMVKLILGSIPREMYGLGSSLAETMRLVGNIVSMAITTVGFAIYLGEAYALRITGEHETDSCRLFGLMHFNSWNGLLCRTRRTGKGQSKKVRATALIFCSSVQISV